MDFGEIRIPRDYVKENEVKGIEEDHECIIKTRGDYIIINYIVIVPRYLAEKRFVCSCNQEDKSRLEQWFNKNSREVVAKLLADCSSKCILYMQTSRACFTSITGQGGEPRVQHFRHNFFVTPLHPILIDITHCVEVNLMVLESIKEIIFLH